MCGISTRGRGCGRRHLVDLDIELVDPLLGFPDARHAVVAFHERPHAVVYRCLDQTAHLEDLVLQIVELRHELPHGSPGL
jgi:hypothetical protein